MSREEWKEYLYDILRDFMVTGANYRGVNKIATYMTELEKRISCLEEADLKTRQTALSESYLMVELRAVAEKLERWAAESEDGGWSTHQVKPMRQLANHIYATIGRGRAR